MIFSRTMIESFTEIIGLFYRSLRVRVGTVILLLRRIWKIEVGWFRRSIDSERLRVSPFSSAVVEEPVVIIGVDAGATSEVGDRFL